MADAPSADEQKKLLEAGRAAQWPALEQRLAALRAAYEKAGLEGEAKDRALVEVGRLADALSRAEAAVKPSAATPSGASKAVEPVYGFVKVTFSGPSATIIVSGEATGETTNTRLRLPADKTYEITLDLPSGSFSPSRCLVQVSASAVAAADFNEKHHDEDH